MKLFFLVIVILLPAQKKTNLIDWEAGRKLTWNDFEAKAQGNSDNVALTSTHINFKFGYGSSGFTYSITCQFDKSRSWVKIKSNYILGHEQGHFDIAELHARKLKKALSSYEFKQATASADINKIYEELMKQHEEMQNLYDQQTDHSRKTDQQEAWLKKIIAALNEMKAYAHYR